MVLKVQGVELFRVKGSWGLIRVWGCLGLEVSHHL